MKRILAITIVAILVLSIVIGLGLKNRVISKTSGPIETYIGGECTCPGKPGRIVDLYRSKGDSIEKVKIQNQAADCRLLGCAAPTEYRLYK
jgi:hypothetical protein